MTTAATGAVGILALDHADAALAAVAWLLSAGALLCLVHVVVRCTPTRRPWAWTAVVTGGLLLSVAAQRHLDPVLRRWDGAVNLFRITLFTAAMIATIATYTWFVAWAARKLAGLVGANHGRWYAILAAVPALVCLAPRVIVLLSLRPWSDVGVHSVIAVVDVLTVLNTLLLSGCLLVGLRLAAGENWTALDGGVRLAAMVTTAVLCYVDDRWAYIPITIVLGLAITALLVRRVDDALPGPLVSVLGPARHHDRT